MMAFTLPKPKKRNLFRLILISIGLFSCYLYSTPYLSLLRFKILLDRNDLNKANEFIDYPSVRSSLKEQIDKRLSTKLSRDISNQMIGTPLGELTMIIINPIVNKLVSATIDTTVSPKGLKILLEQGRLVKKTESSKYPATDIPKKDNKKDIKLYYRNINEFVLENKYSKFKEPITVFWKRDGITGWKLTRIKLPYGIIDSLN